MQVVLRENNTAMLITLAVILKVIYLLSISKSKADPGEVYYFLPPQALNPLHWRR